MWTGFYAGRLFLFSSGESSSHSAFSDLWPVTNGSVRIIFRLVSARKKHFCFCVFQTFWPKCKISHYINIYMNEYETQKIQKTNIWSILIKEPCFITSSCCFWTFFLTSIKTAASWLFPTFVLNLVLEADNKIFSLVWSLRHVFSFTQIIDLNKSDGSAGPDALQSCSFKVVLVQSALSLQHHS